MSALAEKKDPFWVYRRQFKERKSEGLARDIDALERHISDLKVISRRQSKAKWASRYLEEIIRLERDLTNMEIWLESCRIPDGTT